MRPRKTNSRPTDAEIEILNVLWKTGPATVRRIHEEVSKSKPSQYTTTLKLMQIMTGKGLLDRDDSERSHVYRPAVQQEHAQWQMAADLMDRAFSGSLRSLVVGALGGRRATKKELAELRALIEEQEHEDQGGTGRKGKTR
jgi:BlaI family transcriptional regulator, penicillinase repressor